MEPADEMPVRTTWKRRLIRLDEGIYKYQDKDRTEKFVARLKHKGEDYRKFGFPTVSKARQWRESRTGAIADARLFPERKVGQGLTHHTPFQDYAPFWLDSCRAKNLKRHNDPFLPGHPQHAFAASLWSATFGLYR